MMSMKTVAAWMTLMTVVVAVHSEQSCSSLAEEFCKPGPLANSKELCSAGYGAFKLPPGETHRVGQQLQEYSSQHFEESYDYLRMSMHFDTYAKNRAGFKKLFRGLADNTWEKAVDLIKYINKRGGRFSFPAKEMTVADRAKEQHADDELQSLAEALDIHKKLAVQAHTIHKTASHEHYRDPEVASFLEEEFLHQHAQTVRDLSGHTNDLKRLMAGQGDNSLNYFIFDEYLAKL